MWCLKICIVFVIHRTQINTSSAQTESKTHLSFSPSGRPGSPGRRGMTGFRGPPGFVGRQGVKGKQLPIILCSHNTQLTPHWTPHCTTTTSICIVHTVLPPFLWLHLLWFPLTLLVAKPSGQKGDEGVKGGQGPQGLMGSKGDRGFKGEWQNSLS